MKFIKIMALMALLLTSQLFFAQDRPGREKIKALKVAFITERLSLSSGEAQKFWPIYNDHEETMETFRITERTQIRAKLRNLDAISDAEANKLLEQHLKLEAEKQAENEKFIQKLKEVLTAKKTILLLKAEEDFKRELIKRYRQNRGG